MTDARDPIDFNRALGADTEAQGEQLIELMFPRITAAKDKIEGTHVLVIEDRSSLRMDDAYLGQWRGGALHTTAMGASLDALMTLQTLLEPVLARTGALPMTSLYPLLRSAIENASLAIYLLEPKSRDVRLLRSYKAAADDGKWQTVFMKEIGRENAECWKLRNTVYIYKLIRLRLNPTAPRTESLSLPKYTELVKIADRAVAADPATRSTGEMPLVAWWQLLSGMSHGKFWAMRAALERSGAQVDAENESAYIRMTSSTAVVGLALQRAIETLETALNLYARRSLAVWAQPEDASEPTYVTMAARRRARNVQG
jgi:hypothetical protein